jgi:hypothetical protein
MAKTKPRVSERSQRFCQEPGGNFGMGNDWGGAMPEFRRKFSRFTEISKQPTPKEPLFSFYFFRMYRSYQFFPNGEHGKILKKWYA